MSLPAPSEKRAMVERMFDRIAPDYDRMNRWITLGIDRSWRRRTIDAVAIEPGERFLDLACGTGDFAGLAVAKSARVVGADFAAGMLGVARRRNATVAWVRADAVGLPFAGGSFDALVSGFAIRNFTDLRVTFAECARVLRAGGRLALLEVDAPRRLWLRAGHGLYFRRIVPLLGKLLAADGGDAYRYLPESVAYLPDEDELAEMIGAAGFEALHKTSLLGGTAQIVTARKRA